MGFPYNWLAVIMREVNRPVQQVPNHDFSSQMYGNLFSARRFANSMVLLTPSPDAFRDSLLGWWLFRNAPVLWSKENRHTPMHIFASIENTKVRYELLHNALMA